MGCIMNLMQYNNVIAATEAGRAKNGHAIHTQDFRLLSDKNTVKCTDGITITPINMFRARKNLLVSFIYTPNLTTQGTVLRVVCVPLSTYIIP